MMAFVDSKVGRNDFLAALRPLVGLFEWFGDPLTWTRRIKKAKDTHREPLGVTVRAELEKKMPRTCQCICLSVESACFCVLRLFF